MTLENLLNEFYKENGIPENGGFEDKVFEFKVFGVKLKLPNPKFRQKALYIHDLHHILNKKDISWKGEGFIAGWEIGTRIWKHFPVGVLSLWAMGYSLWIYPTHVFKGYKKGVNNIGLIDLNITKSGFMKMSFNELEEITLKKESNKWGVKNFIVFLFWCLISQTILLFPLILITGIFYLK